MFDHLKSALADRYAIERELGSGGMALVFLAEDLRLHRQVAIKVLRPELAATLGADRFLQEIELTAKLQHPQILPLHEAGEANGFLYYVMPYVEGESLRDRLERDRKLPVDEAIKITDDIAAALNYAHERGVVHRDIKPENVLLTGGRAVVADFGIARAVTAAGGERLTGTGLAIGTPAYMSPEQAMGQEDVDGRSDVYALGCVVYEMLSGEPPHTGPNVQAVLAKALTEDPRPVGQLRRDVPAHIETAVRVAMAKSRDDRFTTARAFADALTGAGAVPAPRGSSHRTGLRAVAIAVPCIALLVASVVWFTGRAPSSVPILDETVIAVVPFRVTDPTGQLEFLSDGIVELLDAELAAQSDLRIADPVATIRLAERQSPDGGVLSREEALALAARLGAGRLLTGQVNSLDGKRIELRGTLFRVSDGQVVGETSTSSDTLQAVIDRFAVGLLGIDVVDEDRLATLTSASAPAVIEYLAGRRAFRRREYLDAIGHFDRALELDSVFALAAVGLLDAGSYAGNSVSDAGARGRSLINELWDEFTPRDQVYLQAARGFRSTRWVSPAERIAALERVIASAPANTETLNRLGGTYRVWGRYLGIPDWMAKATALFERATEIDSSGLMGLTVLSIISGDADRTRELVEALEASGTSVPRNWQWATAMLLGDSLTLDTIRRSFRDWRPQDVWPIGHWALYLGYPLDDWETAVNGLQGRGVTPLERHNEFHQRWRIAVVRGSMRYGAVLNDSAVFAYWGEQRPSWEVLYLAVVDPGLYDVGVEHLNRMSVATDTTYSQLCTSELFRVTQLGDTMGTRLAAARMREIVAENPAVAEGQCAVLLEAVLETMGGSGTTEVLTRLDSLSRRGAEQPLYNLIVARLWEARGNIPKAYEAAQRHSFRTVTPISLLEPAFARARGRFAVLMGDTASAIDAYQRYLLFRTRPDSGEVQQEVESVRAALNDLGAERRQ